MITVLFILAAGLIMPLFTDDPALDDLTVGLSRVLFPIVILLGLNGLLVGVLNAHDHFTIPALSPLVWNLVIIAAMVGLTPLLEGDDQIYAYAIGVLAGTACQFAMAFPVLHRLHIPIRVNFHWRDPRIRRVLLLMLPVTIGLGLINFNLLINTFFGFRISDEAPARDRQGVPDLHAAAGHVLRRRGDGAVPGARRGSSRGRTGTACAPPRRTASARSRCC